MVEQLAVPRKLNPLRSPPKPEPRTGEISGGHKLPYSPLALLSWRINLAYPGLGIAPIAWLLLGNI